MNAEMSDVTLRLPFTRLVGLGDKELIHRMYSASLGQNYHIAKS
jgi:hypothetical protein